MLRTGSLLFFIFILGVFIPSSINQQTTGIFFYSMIILEFSIIVLMLRKQNQIPLSNLLLTIIPISLLLIFTVTSGYTEIRMGYILHFTTLFFIFFLNFKTLEPQINKEVLRKQLFWFNIMFLSFAFLIIFQNTAIYQFTLNWYTAYYDDLVANMLVQQKPVVSFGTHSIAGFYTFIFFFMNIITYIKSKKTSFLLFSILYMICLYFLSSSTSYFYLFFAMLILLFLVYKKSKAFFVVFTLGVVVFAMSNGLIVDIISNTYYKMTSESNGLLARYSLSGVLAYNIEYIKDNPFKGIGFAYSDQFRFIDSGIVEYFLRGGLFFASSLLFALFLFIKRNITLPVAIPLFLFIALFEVGFSNLIYARTLLMLPFIIFYFSKMLEENTSH